MQYANMYSKLGQRKDAEKINFRFQFCSLTLQNPQNLAPMSMERQRKVSLFNVIDETSVSAKLPRSTRILLRQDLVLFVHQPVERPLVLDEVLQDLREEEDTASEIGSARF